MQSCKIILILTISISGQYTLWAILGWDFLTMSSEFWIRPEHEGTRLSLEALMQEKSWVSKPVLNKTRKAKSIEILKHNNSWS